ncbi:sugar kinase [Terrarubrum flagellatum]|uniref:sugar kinase n=1 Tax=Terrirubrum flagellatum TaxID=2895980 RepID=UPI00314535EC
MMTNLIAIGECMVELARGNDGRFGLAYGGDTFNTAVYASRMGASVAYATALGDDAYSDGIAALAEEEGVDVSLIPRRKGRMPGLYLIETSAEGERTFFYWRDRSPARELFEHEDAATKIAARMKQSAIVYFSGITLSLYSDAGLDKLESALRDAKNSGARIAFDGNFRPRGWPDRDRAKTIFKRFLSLCDIALPTFDDEQMLWGDKTPEDAIARIAGLGVSEIAVKNGPDGAYAHNGGATKHVEVPGRVAAIDTTAAGDSFNAAYLAARLRDVAPDEAALAGHRLAGVVIQHRGAIVPAEATSGLKPQPASAK